ncbi:MAG: SRPBCC family protein [Bacteroidetes bacterium]|jgi:hypothetical protein|nr:SRPBCC family protein [Bacteroidota bacterium]MDA0879431.1 SRPBCC family protein [Bacteroidota bacterium]MDA1115414.1 SRPBCC family protein [Bacteroidota bacterium]MDP4666108.1 SRPBCC family protein [Flavobacteriaceae bacterium]
MKIEAKKVVVNRSAEYVFDFFNDISNFKKLMPPNLSKFQVIDKDTFVFGLQGMPEITLKKKESVAPSKIVFGAANSPIDFALSGHISPSGINSAEVQLSFEGKMNPMMSMMVKGPLTKLLGQFSDGLTQMFQ